jgi:hypothetical protein
MQNADRPLYQDPDYVQGQIASLQSLVLGLANLLASKEEFQAESLRRLDNLKTAHLSAPVSDARLQAIDDCEAWLLKVTE